MKPNKSGFQFYRGPSLLQPSADVVAIATGLRNQSVNVKTGRVIQVWILRSDMSPMEAIRAGADDAICGDCKFRGDGHGYGRTCYVTPWHAPQAVYRTLPRYPTLAVDDAAGRVLGWVVRLGAYGDPAAVPFLVWAEFLAHVHGWMGYTHAWRTCDPRMRELFMASVDSVDEQQEATRLGWRTFRVAEREEVVRIARAPLRGDDVVCPASLEGGNRATCETCSLCCGTWKGAQRSVVIAAHGRRATFYPSSVAAAADRYRLALIDPRVTP